MKKLLLAALLAGTAVSADAAVTFAFTGSADDGGLISGSITIDTDVLTGHNGAKDAGALFYSKDDNSPGTSTLTSPFLTVNFTSTGGQPHLLSSGDFTAQLLQADSTGFLQLELDWETDNGDGTLTYSRFGFSGFDLTAFQEIDGVLLPDFRHVGTLGFSAESGTGPAEIPDISTTGSLSFGTTAVPETSTWAMMMIGFGAVGYAARRRTRVAFA